MQHPWETFSSLSPHWKGFLAELKKAPDYEEVVSSIPQEARTRFAVGARSILSAEDAVEDLYEPMIYLAAQPRRVGVSDDYSRASMLFDSTSDTGSETARFGVEDVEFNSLVLRSLLALVNIGRVLVEHSSVCTGFTLTQKELLSDMEELHSMANGLEEALIGSNSTRGLWNASSDFFADSSRVSVTSTHSLRGFLPGYAAELDDNKKMLSMKHFLSEPGSFSFFCAQFPASFFACSGDNSLSASSSSDGYHPTNTWILYNYFLQRGFSRVGLHLLEYKTTHANCLWWLEQVSRFGRLYSQQNEGYGVRSDNTYSDAAPLVSILASNGGARAYNFNASL
ncbi:unnamed protein product [Phytophthora fragariaefolia]|uniref:Unnamed protein product n=1 Tax=Phytophthora fragariaefolia TaxID=1490495 RepID=A0A9W7CQ59_9STRA|nr:unnamed protein product [Phytophthora fragariaefolia]